MADSSRLDDNKAATRKIIEIFSSGDLSAVSSLISPNYIDHQGLSGITIHGTEGFRQVVTVAGKALADLNVVIQDLIAEGDKVVVRLRWHGTAPTGKKIDRETIDILCFLNGQMIEHWGAETWTSEEP